MKKLVAMAMAMALLVPSIVLAQDKTNTSNVRVSIYNDHSHAEAQNRFRITGPDKKGIPVATTDGEELIMTLSFIPPKGMTQCGIAESVDPTDLDLLSEKNDTEILGSFPVDGSVVSTGGPLEVDLANKHTYIVFAICADDNRHFTLSNAYQITYPGSNT